MYNRHTQRNEKLHFNVLFDGVVQHDTVFIALDF